MIVYDKEQKQIVIPNGLGNVNIVINQGGDCPECPELTEISITENGRYEGAYNVVNVDVPTGGGDKPTPPQDGWGMVGNFNDWGFTGGVLDIPFEEDGEWDGRPYKVIRGFEATGGEFKIRRNNAWTDSYTANFGDIPQFAQLRKDDWNMYIDDGVLDIYLFFGNDGVPNEMLILHTGTDLSTIKYEYTLTISVDKENAIIEIFDGYTGMTDRYYGGATVPMKLGNSYGISIYMEGYENINEELACRNDEERTYTLTKIEGYGCNLISPIVFSKDAGNTINAERVQIPTFVYEGNQYYNVDSFNLADIEEFKIQILFKPNNSGNEEPINVFGCEDTDWDDTTFGARIYQGQIYFRMSGQDVQYPYTENTWYDVEMGYNATKRWVFVNRETLLESDHTSFDRPRQTLMIGAINSGGNAFRPFYGKIAATYIKSNANQVWLLPKEDGTMAVYWNNLINSRNSISGNNNARFENDNLSGDGMKSITWLGNLEDKWVTPSMNDRDSNGYIVVSPSEGYSGLKRTVINPQTLYNEGVEAGRAEGQADAVANAKTLEVTENGQYGDGETLYKTINVNVVPKVNVKEAGLKFGNSTFTEVPEWADFEGITDMSHMFYECNSLETIPLIDTSNVTDMYGMFEGCSNLQTIPQLNTSNVTNMSAMFMFCNNLQTIPEIDTSNVTNMRFMFSMRAYQANHLSSLPKFNCQKVTNISDYFASNGMSSLTDVGGWENLKCNWNDAYGLVTCPNLTHQSCINILNGLYDFTGNGETPNSNQGKLKVAQSFLDKVGDEISIGVAKGWTITAE